MALVELATLDTQRCVICGIDKPLPLFRKASTCVKGVRKKCRVCDGARETAREYQKRNRIRPDNQGVRGRCRNMVNNAKTRSLDKGLDFDLTLDFLVSICPKECPVLNEPLNFMSSGGIRGRCPFVPSLDRFDNTKGYTKDNVRIISWRANCLKSDSSIEELEKVLQYMKGN